MTPLTDAQWARVEHLFDESRVPLKAGRPLANSRAVLNAIRWIQHSGERWIYLPAHFPPQQTCYIKFLAWKKSGLLDEVERLLDAGCKCADGSSTAPCDDH